MKNIYLPLKQQSAVVLHVVIVIKYMSFVEANFFICFKNNLIEMLKPSICHLSVNQSLCNNNS